MMTSPQFILLLLSDTSEDLRTVAEAVLATKKELMELQERLAHHEHASEIHHTHQHEHGHAHSGHR